MKKIIAVLFVLFSSSVMATNAFWEKSRVGYTIYFTGGFAETPFNDLNVPRYGTSITNVSWDWNQLPVTTNVVKLCYQKVYSSTKYPCIEITEDQQGNSDIFNGLDARGTFQLKMTGYGGTYPVYSSQRLADTIRVDYSY